jgi:hypothetical protein
MELAAAAVTPGLPCLLVWASRSAAELETMGPLVLAMAQALQLQLTTKLFFTGELILSQRLTQSCGRCEVAALLGGCKPV